MRFSYFYLSFLLIVTLPGYSQVVSFSQLPASYQLYPRNDNSVATIPVVGQVLLPGYDRITMLVYRNTTLYQYIRQPIAYSGNVAPFSLSTTIPAELAEFRIQIFAHQSGDSVQVADRRNIVAGDAYIINGQSNASAYSPAYGYQSEYVRTFGVYATNLNYDPYNPADTLWTPCGQTGSTSAGVWGMEIARQITERYGIPVCMLNGAAGGADIGYLSIRNDNNPTDLNTNHGRMLYRVRKAGLTGTIKAYFYRQGENETSGNASGWPANFDQLYQNVRLDYPELGRFYLFQIHLLGGSLEPTAVFRDYQRRAGSLYPLIQSYATVGTTGYDGVHFNVAGHTQTGAEMFRLVARDFYGASDTDQIYSPNIQKAYYRTSSQNEIVVQFEEDQQLVWPSDTTVSDTYGTPITHQPAQWFLLNKQGGNVASGSTDGYRLLLTLNGSRSEQKLAYLPPNYPLLDGGGNPLPGYARAFPGPFLKNKRGLRAFSFWEIPIGAPLAPLTNLAASSITNVGVLLTWNDHPTEQRYILERKLPSDAVFKRLTELPAGSSSFVDLTALTTGTYQYRLRAVTDASEATADVSASVNNNNNCPGSNELTSLRSGNWQDPQIWYCGRVPTTTDRVRIATSHQVILQQDVTIRTLQLEGALLFQANAKLKLFP